MYRKPTHFNSNLTKDFVKSLNKLADLIHLYFQDIHLMLSILIQKRWITSKGGHLKLPRKLAHMLWDVGVKKSEIQRSGSWGNVRASLNHMNHPLIDGDG